MPHFSKNFKIFTFIFILFLFSIFIIQRTYAENNNYLESFKKNLPGFIQNFIKNITKISVEKVTPEFEKTGIGDVLGQPAELQARQNFFEKIRNWFSQLSLKINAFFKFDIGWGFGKIMNLFIYWFNKIVDFIKNLFT